jgi:hypothetical protein
LVDVETVWRIRIVFVSKSMLCHYGLKQSVNFTGVIPLILTSFELWKTHEFTGIRPYELMPHSLLKGKLKNILVQTKGFR